MAAGGDGRERSAEPPGLPVICQQLWNGFDPIGVSGWAADWNVETDDEYLSYVPHTVALIEQGADRYKLTAFVESCVYVSMSRTKNDQLDREIAAFVTKLLALRH